MRKIVVLACLFFAVTLLTWNVYADPDPFTRIDTNKDGTISAKEFDDAVRAKFKEYDKNKDGRISVEEFAASGHPEAVKEFKFMDRNSDGFVSSDEFFRAAIQRRDQIDFNRDSKISKEEYNSNKALPLLKFYF